MATINEVEEKLSPVEIACFWCKAINLINDLAGYNIFGAECWNCGEDLGEEADWEVICPWCDKNAGTPESPESDMFCPHCGAEI